MHLQVLPVSPRLISSSAKMAPEDRPKPAFFIPFALHEF